jgi:hypothetical protein
MEKHEGCDHYRIEVMSTCPDCGQELDRKTIERRGLSQEEMNAQQGAELPDREQMSLVNLNAAAPINLALAPNVLSDGSIAYANATQYAPITQSTGTSLPTTGP